MVCVCVVSVGSAQQSQTGASSLRVLVTDTQQRALAGAVCSIRPTTDSAKVAATATTDEEGIAVFPATLTSGNYTLRVESQGFETLNRSDVIINDGAVTDITVSLKIAAVTESVTVAAPADEATNVQAGAFVSMLVDTKTVFDPGPQAPSPGKVLRIHMEWEKEAPKPESK